MGILRPAAVLVVAWVFVATAASRAQTTTPPLDVQVAGHGEPSLIFIPGLACPGSVWDHTVAHFEGTHRCHVVSLAGFGGKPPVRTEHYLDDMADAIIAYVRTEKLDRPVLIGHSLGGVLALKIALKAPDLPGRLVIVDSLPFLAGMMGSGIDDAPAAKTLADGWRKSLTAQTPAQFAAGQNLFIGGMVTSPEKASEIAAQTGKSDPATAGQAMGELLTTDLRPDLGKIRCPTLVLGTVADKLALGMTREAVEAGYRRQYRSLPGVRIVFFEKSRHFLMVDDPDGFYTALNKALAAP